MKTLLTAATAILFLTLASLAPAIAADSDYLLTLDGIDAQVALSRDGVLDLANENLVAGAMLLPAIQKIREASAGASKMCSDRNGTLAACFAPELAGKILDSDDAGDPSLSLLDLYLAGTGLPLEDAQRLLNQSFSGHPGAKEVESMLNGLLIGLLKEMKTLKMPAAVIAPINEAQKLVDGIAPGKPQYKATPVKAAKGT
ncbi:MAG: hypothetical protein ABI743_00975 [bacterium]